MQPEVSLSPAQRRIEAFLPEAWRVPLAQLAACWAVLSLLLWSDWASMADQWWNSSTYNHILLIPPILGWLVWQRRDQLAQLAPQAWWPALAVVFGALFLWLLGAVGGIGTARHLGLVMALVATAIALLGPRVSWVLAFPMAYALFLVPIGDELVPALQMITAKITIALTNWSGIPAEIEGVFIDTPAGLFEVAEACSGVKFLIAMVALGVLTCHLFFRSWTRRALFMALCAFVPIIANGIRAWGTIYLAQIFGIEFAASFDHIVYGWVFFAIVVAILLAVGWRMFDRSLNEATDENAAVGMPPIVTRLARLRVSGSVVFIAIPTMALAAVIWAASASRVEARLPERSALPAVEGWELSEYRPDAAWEPLAGGASHRLIGRYRDGQGREVDVFVALYSRQGEGHEAGGFGQGALPPDGSWSWVLDEQQIFGARVQRLQAMRGYQRVAATWYRHGNYLGGSNSQLRIASLRNRLFLTAEPTVMLIVSAEESQGGDAAERVAAFVQSVEPLDRWMDGFTHAP